MKKRSLDLLLPVKALSTNKLYTGQKRRSWHYKKFRKEVFRLLDNSEHPSVSLKGNLVLELTVGVSSRLTDASNCIKGIEDIVSEYYGFNDRQIVSVRVDKYLVPKGQEFTHIKVRKTRRNIEWSMNYSMRLEKP